MVFHLLVIDKYHFVVVMPFRPVALFTFFAFHSNNLCVALQLHINMSSEKYFNKNTHALN